MAGLCPVCMAGMMLPGDAHPCVQLRGGPGLSVMGRACTSGCGRHVGCALEETEELGWEGRESCTTTRFLLPTAARLTGTHVGVPRQPQTHICVKAVCSQPISHSATTAAHPSPRAHTNGIDRRARIPASNSPVCVWPGPCMRTCVHLCVPARCPCPKPLSQLPHPSVHSLHHCT